MGLSVGDRVKLLRRSPQGARHKDLAGGRGTITALRTDKRGAAKADVQFDTGDLLLGLAIRCLAAIGAHSSKPALTALSPS